MNPLRLLFCLLLVNVVAAQAQISIDPPSRTFAKEGGSGSVLTSGSGTWTATTSTPWITLNRATASAGTSCLYTVSANFTAETRQGSIAINGNTHTVTQTGYPASLDPSFVNLDRNAATGSLQINTAAGVSWNAVSNVPWLSFSPSSGSGPSTISYAVQGYTGVVTRTGLATIAGQTFTVNQTGVDVNVSPAAVSKGPGADIFEVQITALATTSWSVTPQQPWISVVDGGTGRGDSSVILAVSANPSYLPRTGTVAIGTSTVQVTQEPTANLALNLSPMNTTASYQGAIGNIAVSATPDGPWTAESLSPWITLGAGSSSGSGNGNVGYVVSANPTIQERTGQIRVKLPFTNRGVDLKRSLGMHVYNDSTDESGWNNHLSRSLAIRFNGGNPVTCVNKAKFPAGNEQGLTLAFWFELGDLGTVNRLFQHQKTTGTTAIYTDTENRLIFHSDGQSLVTSAVIEAGVTYQLVVTADAAKRVAVHLGRRGGGGITQVGEQLFANAAFDWVSPTGILNFTLGEGSIPSQGYLNNASVNDLRLYARVLNDNELIALFFAAGSIFPYGEGASEFSGNPKFALSFSGSGVAMANSGYSAISSNWNVIADRSGRPGNALLGNGSTSIYPNKYDVVVGPYNWADARKDAARKGGRLAIVDSARKDSAVHSRLGAGSANQWYWMGLTDEPIEGVWRWIDGYNLSEVVSYTNWESGEPNNQNNNEDYGSYWWNGGINKWRWNDYPSSQLGAYLLEYPFGGIVSGYDPSANSTQSSWMRFDGFPAGAESWNLWSGPVTVQLVSGPALKVTSGTSSVTFASPSLQLGKWHHLAFSGTSGGQLKVYIDGVEIGNSTILGAVIYGQLPTYIGGWNGAIDQYAVYEGALTTAQVRAIYEAEKPLELIHTVVQGVSPTSLTPVDTTVPANAGSVDTLLTVANNVTWTASSNSAWLTLLSSSSGAGPTTVRWSATSNPTVYERVATVTVAGVTAQIRQPGRAVTVSSSNVILPPDGGSVQVSVSAEGGASWQSVPVDSWLSVIAGATGAGSGNVTIVADPYNQPTASRTGLVLVAGQTVYVTQRGYELTVSPTAAQFYANSGSATISVSAPLSAIWQAIASHPWITITGGSNGMGGGTVTYTIASNSTGQTRSGRIVIAGTEYTIQQAASAPDPVTIAAAPVGGTVNPGQSFSFSVGVTGSGPFTYQWRRNLVNVVGAINSTYVIQSVNEGHEGSYDCVVTNILGNVISPAAVLTVNDPLLIQSQPVSRTVNPATSVSFAVAATGAQPITYQWRKGGVNLPGQTGAQLVLPAVVEADEGGYDVVLTNPVGTLTSSAATLSVNEPVQITAQPQDRTLNPGVTLSLSVSATGTAPITYQWRKNGLPVTGATGNVFSLATVTEQDAGEYDVVVTNVVGILTSLPSSVVVNQAPRFTTQPVGQQLNPGAAATFVVVAEGMTPLSYQWRKDGLDLTGETQSTLTVTDVSNAKEGSYTCRVTNPVGSLVSQVAVLAVNDPVQVTAQPVARTVNPGAAVSFSITATGTSPAYQWRKNGVAILGATAATYSIGSSTESHEGSHDCVISNMLGSVTSQAAALIVNDPVVITGQPVAQAVDVNTPLTLQVSATGTGPLTYQWRKAGLNVVGATTATLAIALVQAADAGSYDVLVSNAVGTVTSQAALVTVNLPPAITTQPADLTLNPGSTAVFTVASTGQMPLTYQWFKNGQSIAGAQSATLSLASIAESAEASYAVVVTNRLGEATSRSALLVVNDPVTITTQPLARTVNPGAAASFSVTATGATPSYQWRRNGAPISGATSATYSIASVVEAQEGSYDCVVSNVVGSVTSNTALLSVNDPVVITTQPVNRTLVEGANLNLSVSATGTGPLAYQWKKGGAILAGATASAYAVASVTAAEAGSYTVEISNPVGTVTSNAVNVTVNQPVTISTQPVPRTVNPDTPLSFSVAATGTSPSYQWRRNGAPISGATSATYSIASVVEAQEGSYDCVVSNVVGSVTSNTALLSVNDPVVITLQPVSQTLNPGALAVFTVQATGTGPLAYQWKKDGVTLAGANAASYSVASAALVDAGSYTVEVSNIVGTVTSSAALFAVNLPITITAQPQSRTVNPGVAVSFSVTASGTSPSYQWRRNGVNLPGATSATYSIASAAELSEGAYDCVVSNVVGSVTTSAAVLSVNDPLAMTAQPASRVVNPEVEVVFMVTATGTGPISYQWRRNGVNLVGATSSSLVIENAKEGDEGSYTCLLSNAVGDLLSNAAVLGVNDPVVLTAQPISQSRNPGQAAVFNVTATGTGPITYQWRRDGVNLAGATNATLTLPAVEKADEGSYTCAANNVVGQVVSTAAVLSVSDAPVITTAPLAQTVNPGASISLSVGVGGTAPFSYQWRRNGALISGATSATLPLASVTEANEGSYTVTVTNAVGSVTSPAVDLVVNDPVVILQQPRGGSVSLGSSLGLAVLATGTDPLTYQWRRNGADVSGATNTSFLVEALTEAAAGTYDVRITNTVGSVISQPAVVTVDAGAPRIVAAPLSQVIVVGGTAEFEVRASGAGPLTYQWRRNGQAIAGAADAVLRLDDVQLAKAGSYSVQVTGPGGVASSTAAQLGVVESVIRTVHQAPGTTATFAIRANGSGLFYEWRKDGVPLAADPRVAGQGTTRLSVRSIRPEDAGFYTCRVSWVAASGQVLDSASILAGEYELVALQGKPALVRPFSLPMARVGAYYEYALPTDPTPGLMPTWFKATGLPAGLNLDTDRGVIRGWPTVGREAPYAVSIVAGNASGSDTVTAALKVDSLPVGLSGAFVAAVPRHRMATLGGRLDLNVTSAGSASGRITLGSVGYSFGGSLLLDETLGQAVLKGTIPRRGLSALSFELSFYPEDDRFTGWIQEDSEQLEIEGRRQIWHTRNQPALGHDGVHNLALHLPAELSGDPQLPASGGFASVAVSTSGYFKYAGRTGVGQVTTAGGFVGPRGEMVVHAMLGQPGGSLSGLIQLDAETVDGAMDATFSAATSLLTWSLSEGTATIRLYRTGFGPVELSVDGGQYVAPGDSLMLDLPLPVTPNNARLIFLGAELPASGPDIEFSVLAANKLLLPRLGPENPRGTKLQVNVRNGTWTGGFTIIESNPFTKNGAPQNLTRNVQFQGLLIPGRSGQPDYGHGYFLMPKMPSNVDETLAKTSILGGAVRLSPSEN